MVSVPPQAIDSGFTVSQIAIPHTVNGYIAFRQRYNTGVWSTWKKAGYGLTATDTGALPITGGTLTGDIKSYGGNSFVIGSDSTREFRIRQNGTEFELGRYVDGTLAYACMAVRPTSFDMVFRCANPSSDVRFENGKMIYGETAEGVALHLLVSH